VSARSFARPTARRFQHIYTDMSRIYFVTLAKDTTSPSRRKRRGEAQGGAEPAPRTRSRRRRPAAAAAPAASTAKPDVKAADAKPAGSVPAVKVDLDGIVDRIGVLPTPAANYRR